MNNGGLVIPIIIEFEYGDGTKESKRIPAEIRRFNHKVESIFELSKCNSRRGENPMQKDNRAREKTKQVNQTNIHTSFSITTGTFHGDKCPK